MVLNIAVWNQLFKWISVSSSTDNLWTAKITNHIEHSFINEGIFSTNLLILRIKSQSLLNPALASWRIWTSSAKFKVLKTLSPLWKVEKQRKGGRKINFNLTSAVSSILCGQLSMRIKYRSESSRSSSWFLLIIRV